MLGTLVALGLAGYTIYHVSRDPKSKVSTSYTEARNGLRYWTAEEQAVILKAFEKCALVPVAANEPGIPPGSLAMFELMQSSPVGMTARNAVEQAVKAGMAVATSGTLGAALDGLGPKGQKQFVAIIKPAVRAQVAGLDRLFVLLAEPS